MKGLVKFYSNLYRSRVNYSTTELQEYLQAIELPGLSTSQSTLLDSPIKLEELQEALSLFPNSEAPGDDGIPMEVFKQYGGIMLPRLLKVLKAGFHSIFLT